MNWNGSQLLKQTKYAKHKGVTEAYSMDKARRSFTDQMEVGSKGPINPHSYQFQHRKCC